MNFSSLDSTTLLESRQDELEIRGADIVAISTLRSFSLVVTQIDTMRFDEDVGRMLPPSWDTL